jgi:hypothetical protein
VVGLLYGSGIISHTQECETYQRINALEDALSKGADIEGLLVALATAEHEAWANRLSLTTGAVIANNCGLAQRAHYENFVRSAVGYIRGINSWPEWWGLDADISPRGHCDSLGRPVDLSHEHRPLSTKQIDSQAGADLPRLEHAG